MRILVAPDGFGGALTAAQAAEAIAEGWHRRAPADELDLAPMADGGPGFVAAVRASVGGELLAVGVRGPYGERVPGAVLRAEDGTAYAESAQACGLHLTRGPGSTRDPAGATTHGVGDLVMAAVDAGATTVVVGLGGSGTSDGGAGLLSALGARSEPDGLLDRGPDALAGLQAVDLRQARSRVAGVRLVAATDVDIPLAGLFGATRLHGTRKGLPDERLPAVDAALERLAELTDRRTALARGAGAGGGLGFALMLLGAQPRPGVALVAETVGLAERARAADLVVTGEGAFDFSSRSGTVTYGVAAVAADAVRPCVALAGTVLVSAREMRALGVESAYSMADALGERAALDPAGSLARLAERVAATWSR